MRNPANMRDSAYARCSIDVGHHRGRKPDSRGMATFVGNISIFIVVAVVVVVAVVADVATPKILAPTLRPCSFVNLSP